MSDSANQAALGTTILYPTDYFPTQNKDQMKLIDSFIEDLERSLGVKRTPISLSSEWTEISLGSAVTTSLPDFLATVGSSFLVFQLAGYNVLMNLEGRDNAVLQGRLWPSQRMVLGIQGKVWEEAVHPPCTPMALVCSLDKDSICNNLTNFRDMANNLTPGERDEGWERISTYRDWLLKNVFKPGTIMVLPLDTGTPSYRDAPPP